MGERLAKEADALWKAKVEQIPAWHEAMEGEGVTPLNAPRLLLEMTGALREIILYVASQVEDPPIRET